MNDESKSDSEDGMTRRDFVRGRFWPVRVSRPPTANSPAGKTLLVMRYPKTLEDVEATDAEQESTANTSTIVTSPSARRRTIPILRPPGAIDEESFLAGCTRCDECRKVCPHDAIMHAPAQMREAAGTPMIQADHQACMMCQDFPCIAACEVDVLTSTMPPIMGTAKVNEHLCIAHHGTTCTTCSERCPVEGAIVAGQGKPTVDESKCTGCGVCRHVCPAPENAILLMPSFQRPAHPGRADH